MPSRTKKRPVNKLGNFFTGLGIGLLVLAAILLFRLFHDPLNQEARYLVRSLAKVEKKVTPPNTNFALVIDKLAAAAAIAQNVDPFDSRDYQKALTQGIAHAKGTKTPGEGGNIFLFAHSSADLLTAERYNSIFYLLHHLEQGDVIKVWSKGQEYHYLVSEKVVTAPSDTHYLTNQTSTEQLTLMTCWPPGTTLKRLIIIAKPLPL